jgi:hypothetical protein
MVVHCAVKTAPVHLLSANLLAKLGRGGKLCRSTTFTVNWFLCAASREHSSNVAAVYIVENVPTVWCSSLMHASRELLEIHFEVENEEVAIDY